MRFKHLLLIIIFDCLHSIMHKTWYYARSMLYNMSLMWTSIALDRFRRTETQSVSRSVTSDSLRPHGLQPARLLCPWDSPGKKIGVGCYSLLQGIFPTQGLNPDLPHCRQILYHLSHQGIITGSFLKNPRELLIGTDDSSSLGENSEMLRWEKLHYDSIENYTWDQCSFNRNVIPAISLFKNFL